MIDEYKYTLFDNIFHLIHYNNDYEICSTFTTGITKYASVSSTIIELYEHFCAQNGITPMAEIIVLKNTQNQVDPREEFIEKYRKCHKDDMNGLHLGLNLDLDGGAVYDLYSVLIQGYIDASQTTLDQFCYALTGKMRPEKIEQVEWKGSIDEFALFVNALFKPLGGNNPQALFCVIFSGTDSDFNRANITSRCCRVNDKKIQYSQIRLERLSTSSKYFR